MHQKRQYVNRINEELKTPTAHSFKKKKMFAKLYEHGLDKEEKKHQSIMEVKTRVFSCTCASNDEAILQKTIIGKWKKAIKRGD